MFDVQKMNDVYGNTFKFCSDACECWTRMMTGITDSLKNGDRVSPCDVMNNMNQTATRNIRIYRAWLDYLDCVSSKAFELGYNSASGDIMKTDQFQFLSTVRDASDSFTASVTTVLKNTPFEDMNIFWESTNKLCQSLPPLSPLDKADSEKPGEARKEAA
ncbi:hypothetical protein QUF80_15955 [Desulfococcaceae bacterium HSG8]|nr:hypothetical protein [Desulfococcaceae bacterium HSG8]